MAERRLRRADRIHRLPRRDAHRARRIFSGDEHFEFDSENEVITRQRDRYGLAAGVVTPDLKSAHRIIGQQAEYLLDQYLGRIARADAGRRLQAIRH